VFQIVNAAADEMIERFRDTSVVAASNTISFASDVAQPDATPAVGVVHLWHDVQSMWENSVANVSDVDVQYGKTAPIWFDFAVRYLDASDEVQTYTREPTIYVTAPAQTDPSPSNVPDWTVNQLFTALRKMLGWKYRADYAPFPSTLIVVTIYNDRFPVSDPAGLATIDEAIEKGQGIELQYEEADSPDFALNYPGSWLDRVVYVQDDVGGDPIFSETMDPLAYYGTSRFEPDGDGQPTNETVEEIAFHLPHYYAEEEDASFTSPAGAPADYKEKITRADVIFPDTSDKVYVGEFVAQDDATGQAYELVLRRELERPASGQLNPVSPYWAAYLFLNYQVRTVPTLSVRLDVDIDALTERILIADPALGVSYLEKAWIIKELEHRLFQQSASLTLIRRASDEGIVLADSVPDGTIDTPELGSVVGFDARHDRVFDSGGNYVGKDIRLSWSGVEDSEETPDAYEIEHRVYEPGATWTALVTTAATSYDYREFDADVFTDHEYRVRAVTTGAGGTEGPWAYDFAEWTGVNVTA
jgi:hypothetical protein